MALRSMALKSLFSLNPSHFGILGCGCPACVASVTPTARALIVHLVHLHVH